MTFKTKIFTTNEIAWQISLKDKMELEPMIL